MMEILEDTALEMVFEGCVDPEPVVEGSSVEALEEEQDREQGSSCVPGDRDKQRVDSTEGRREEEQEQEEVEVVVASSTTPSPPPSTESSMGISVHAIPLFN